jgi:large subunit ribosomal protein L3
MLVTSQPITKGGKVNMQKGLIGKKVGMTQLFDENGTVIPVTVIEAGPCAVVTKKTMENDGYEAVQLGFGDLKANKVTKPMKGQFDKANVAPKKVLREFRLDDCSTVNVGDVLKADVFAAGDKVDVIGTSRGKGTAGAIKRWNFHRLKESHGTGPNARHAGSLGMCSDPSRVFKGKKLAGHYGDDRVTIQNLDVVKVDAENNLIAIKGAVPGIRGGIVLIKDTVKKA